ncbi:MAG TPA: ATPase P [Smithella sp.]|nr:ATPase P [Smithella sp.]
MLKLNVPGYKTLSLSFLVLDYNGTIACDGHLIPGIKELLIDLSQRLAIHILTADTFGGVKEELQGIPCEIVVIAKENQAQAKADHVRKLDEHKTVCIGNGRNDALMLKEAELGIAVIQTEGCAVDALLAADVVTQDIQEALNLLRHPLRLAATLRS